MIGVHTSVRKYKKHYDIIKDTNRSLRFRTNWYRYMIKKNQGTKVHRDRWFRCQCEIRARRERVSGILLKRESPPGANEVDGHGRGKHYLLSKHYSSALKNLALSGHCCCDVVSCAIRTKLKLRESAGLLALTSDLQQHRSSIMMHPSGHTAARRQRCSHALIWSRQPRSVCTSTWSTPCVVTDRQPPHVLRSSK